MAPQYKEINQNEVSRLRDLHFNWKRVAAFMHVSRSTLERWRDRVEYEDSLVAVSDEILDQFILHNAQRNRGEVYMSGLVRAEGFCVSRDRLRQSIYRVDAVGRQQRKQKAIKRREYHVPGPHHLWHIDGHHKLIKYGLVTHGCVDGFSRAVMYLQCCDNNKSPTPYRLFVQATKEHMIPSKVRGDKGGENVLIADFMILHRGPGRRSFIAGQSKHNTRMERLWGDVRKEVTEYYQRLFADFEMEGLDVENSQQ